MESRSVARLLALSLACTLLGLACGPGAASPSAKSPGGGAPASTTVPAASQPAASGAAAPTASSAAAPTPERVEKVRIAQTISIAFAPMWLADARGYFREQGLEVEWDDFAGGADVVPALARGDFDVNLGAISVGTFNAYDRGLDIKIVAPAGVMPLQDSALPLMVRKELADSGAVATVADLRGRKVAVNVRASVNEYVLAKALEREGLALRDVDVTTLGFPDHPAAYSTGSIDAGTTAEPFATRAVSLGAAVPLVKEIVPGKMITVVMYSGKLIQDRPDVARRWMVAYLKGVRDLQGPELGVSYPEKFYTPENMALFEQRTGASAQVIRNQVPYTWDPDLEIQTDFIMDQQLVHLRNGALQRPEPIPAERLVDDRFVRQAREQLGRLR